MAVNHALTVISWHENLPKDEQPPRKIWHSVELVDKWFGNVEQQREKKYGSSGKSRYEEADDVPMSRNELAESVKKAHGK